MSSQTTFASQVNLEELLKDFNTWQKHIHDVTLENIQLQQNFELQKKTLISVQDAHLITTHELQDTKSLVTNLHEILNKRCDLEDENRNLKEKLRNMMEKFEEQGKCHQDTIDLLHVQLAEEQDRQKAENAAAIEAVKEAAEEEKCSLQKIVTKKEEETAALEQKLCQAEKDKQAEIMQIQLEYNEKVLKMQKQSMHFQQTIQPAGTSQDVFRKKLQHVRSEYDREVSLLRQKVSSLQQQLNDQNKRGPKQPQKPGPTFGSMAKRARRH